MAVRYASQHRRLNYGKMLDYIVSFHVCSRAFPSLWTGNEPRDKPLG